MNEKEMVPYLRVNGWTEHPDDPSYWLSPKGDPAYKYKTTTAYGAQRRYEQRKRKGNA